jgi:ethanolamine utilization protein EutQ
MNKQELETLIRQILAEKLGEGPIRTFSPNVNFTESDRLDTGNPSDRVYTRDLFPLEQSPRLGVGMMYMERCDFPWHLNYDEVDFVLEGELIIRSAQGEVSARAGEGLLIPKGSDIRFVARDKARFLYVTYPADWQKA